VRAVIVSRVYADPATRGKLKALAGLGISVAAAVPERWAPAGVRGERQTSFGEDSGVRTVPVAVRGPTAPGSDPAWNSGALRRLLTDFRPDLLQIEEEPWTRAATTAGLLARRMRIPYLVLTRESLAQPHGIMGRFRRARTLSGARGVVAVNGLAARLAVRDHPALPQRVIPQLGTPLPLAAERVRHTGLSIGFLGRLIPEKGLDLLFRACVKLVGRWTITVVGTGPAQEELEGLAERLGIAGRVTWLGALPRDQVEEIWPRLDCVVLPSRTAPRWIEAMPRAALEAMAHGVAVIASAAGALPELVEGTGIVVPEEDVASLTEALQRLHDDPTVHQRLGGAGRRLIMDRHTDAAVAARTAAFWRESVSATG
jgi:glycosyltransferase involved in cell wall biosynthesis